MRKTAIIPCALAVLGTTLLFPSAARAQAVAEFELNKPPARMADSGPLHLDFTLAVNGANITGARIFLAPAEKHLPARRTWRYVGMVSFFPKGINPHAMFDLPVHGGVHGTKEMIAEPIATGKAGPGALRIVAASIVSASADKTK